MSRDQKPGRAKIVVNAPTRGTSGRANHAPSADDIAPPPRPIAPTKPPYLLAGLFLAFSIIGGFGVAMRVLLVQ